MPLQLLSHSQYLCATHLSCLLHRSTFISRLESLAVLAKRKLSKSEMQWVCGASGQGFFLPKEVLLGKGNRDFPLQGDLRSTYLRMMQSPLGDRMHPKSTNGKGVAVSCYPHPHSFPQCSVAGLQSLWKNLQGDPRQGGFDDFFRHTEQTDKLTFK